MSSLDEYLSARRKDVQAALERYLSQMSACSPVLLDAMRYSLMAGGKRLRPVLTLAAADAIAGRHQVSASTARALATPAACAIEMIHTYSLIHDDLPAMDDDVLRRGRPTLHVAFGEGIAILAGDGLQSEAFSLMAREPASDDLAIADRKLRAIARVASAAGAGGMVGGQAIDLLAVAPLPQHASQRLDANTLKDMHARKTGAIIRASAVAGAIMAGAVADELVAIDRYAAAIGLAFQIVDDILDVEGATTTLGKTAGKDAAAGKPTYPSLYGVERSRQLASSCLTEAHDTLAAAGLSASRLGALADWIVRRES